MGLLTDYQGMFGANPAALKNAGESMNWGGGKLSRNQDGSLLYDPGNNGVATTLTKDTDVAGFAKANSGVNNQWANQYGVNYTANSVPNMGGAVSAAAQNIYTGGLNAQYTKDNPFLLGGNNAGNIKAYNDNGKLMFDWGSGTGDYTAMTGSNFYKGLTGQGDPNAPSMPQTSGGVTAGAGGAAGGTGTGSGTASGGAAGGQAGQGGSTTLSSTSSQNGVTYGNAAQANAANWNVDGNQLVENRLKGLLDDSNPLVQMAKTQGLENAQQRGLLNSSLGAEAGALAQYQYAMPIAQADAQTYANAGRTNAENQTQVNLSNAQMQTQANLTNAGASNSMAQLQTNLAARMAELDKQNANAFAQLDKQNANALRTQYLSSMTAANTQMQAFINSVQAADMPDDAKTAQINAAQESFNNTIRYMDAAYSRMPSWSKEWSLLPATIG